jgi:hypothetical protein
VDEHPGLTTSLVKRLTIFGLHRLCFASFDTLSLVLARSLWKELSNVETSTLELLLDLLLELIFGVILAKFKVMLRPPDERQQLKVGQTGEFVTHNERALHALSSGLVIAEFEANWRTFKLLGCLPAPNLALLPYDAAAQELALHHGGKDDFSQRAYINGDCRRSRWGHHWCRIRRRSFRATRGPSNCDPGRDWRRFLWVLHVIAQSLITREPEAPRTAQPNAALLRMPDSSNSEAYGDEGKRPG